MPPIWVGFWAPNSLNKGPFFGRFSINKGGLSRNWRKMAKKLEALCYFIASALYVDSFCKKCLELQ